MKFDPTCEVYLGAPGSGKTTSLQMRLAQLGAPRVLAWDPKREFQGELVTLGTLRARLAAVGQGPCRLVYRPDTKPEEVQKARFEFWCASAIQARDLLLVVDELADVTSPNPALVPAAWNQVMREQRHYGLRILAASQRPQHLNKDLWDFATRVRAFRLNYTPSRREVANVLDVGFEELAALVECQWIERDMRSGELKRGDLAWKRNTPQDVPRAGLNAKKIPSPPVNRRRLNGKVPIG